jgi:hypothetical protein
VRWYRSLTSNQQRILVVLAVSLIVVLGLLGWSVWSTLDPGRQISPLASPLQSVPATPSPVLTPTAALSATLTLSPTSTPTPTPRSTPTPTPTPRPTFDIANAGLIAADVAEARASSMRWGTALTLVDEYGMTVAFYRHYTSYPPFVLHARQTLSALGLWFWDDLGVDTVTQADQTAAFYAPEIGELYLRRDWDGPMSELETQLAYGYARALPDQYGELMPMLREATTLDRRLTLSAVAQGDALVSVWRYYGIEPGDGAAGVLQTEIAQAVCPAWPVEDILLEELSCLSLDLGGAFATQRYQDGGLPALDEMILRPPRSSEQLLHPERYISGDEPRIMIPLEPALGSSWVLTKTDTLGESLMGTTLLEWSEGRIGAEGVVDWGGDMLQVWDGPEDGQVALWQTVWDNSVAAGRFYAELRRVMPDPLLDGPVTDITVSAGMPRGRWWANERSGVLLYRRAEWVWLVWGNPVEAVEAAGALLR